MDRKEQIGEHLKAAIKGIKECRTVELFGKTWQTFAVNYGTQDGSVELKLTPVLSAPTAAVWSGDGLPPVGCECEFMWDYHQTGSTYVRVKVLAHDERAAIIKVIGGDDNGALRESRGGRCGSGKGQPVFRPLRTAEQLAAEAREKAIDSLCAKAARLADRTESQIHRPFWAAWYDTHGV